MFSKALFTLDGILSDVGGSGGMRGFVLGRHFIHRWLRNRARFDSPLTLQDWMTIEGSALLYGGRLSIKLQQELVDRLLPRSTRPDEPLFRDKGLVTAPATADSR
jgi:hypothetical protein